MRQAEYAGGECGIDTQPDSTREVVSKMEQAINSSENPNDLTRFQEVPLNRTERALRSRH
jgi:hypothetical protein